MCTYNECFFDCLEHLPLNHTWFFHDLINCFEFKYYFEALHFFNETCSTMFLACQNYVCNLFLFTPIAVHFHFLCVHEEGSAVNESDGNVEICIELASTGNNSNLSTVVIIDLEACSDSAEGNHSSVHQTMVL